MYDAATSWGSKMRVVAFAFAVLGVGISLSSPVAAQNFGQGPSGDDPRFGPPRYYTDRPRQDGERPPNFADHPPQRSGEGFRQPSYRGAPPDQGARYDRAGDDRPGVRPDPRDNRESPQVRHVERTSTRTYEPMERENRAGRTTVWPPVRVGNSAPPRSVERHYERPLPRNTERITVSVAEFRELQNRVRELERRLAERHNVRDDRGPYRPTIYR
jgi:hypothetical protein